MKGAMQKKTFPGLFSIMLLLAEGVQANPNPMPLGVDDAGSKTSVFKDAHTAEAFETIGFDFIMYHLYSDASAEQAVDGLIEWAGRTGHDFILNQECASRPQGDPDVYQKGGFFYQPDGDAFARAVGSGHLLGVCYDEAEHWVNQGVWITGGGKPFAPHFYDAEGDSLSQAYEGNVRNLQTLMRRNYKQFSVPGSGEKDLPVVCTEHVFPSMFHVFARAGLSPMPKLLKETITPVAAAMALGCVRQYGTQYWPCLDLWGPSDPPKYPNHSPAELSSALLFAYWTGAQRAYVENFNYQDSLYRVVEDRVQLSAWGDAVRRFRNDYLPTHPRTIRAEEFAPEIVIVRFPDTDWGQVETGCTRFCLYGASNLEPDEQTRYWIRIWHVISHGTIPSEGLNWNAPVKIPYRLFFPANNIAVYDHLASDPRLFASAKLVFLAGKETSPACLATLPALVEKGLVVVTPSYLAPKGLVLAKGKVMKEYASGLGRWIVTDQVDHPDVVALLQPYLGSPDQMRFVFGRSEVVFREDADGTLEVEVSPVQSGK